LRRDDAEIHLWAASDEAWAQRQDFTDPATAWGTREFHALDRDGNLLTFFEAA
jgi:hypothetical protein